jgi:hypothetical protein
MKFTGFFLNIVDPAFQAAPQQSLAAVKPTS